MINIVIGVVSLSGTIGLFFCAKLLYKKYRSPFTLPILTTTIIIVSVLLIASVPYSVYMIGGKWLDHLLGPVVVALGYPLYKQWTILKKYIGPLLIGVSGGAIFGVASGVLLAKVFQFDELIYYSIASKSVTTPVSMDIAKTMGGAPSLAAAFVMMAGIGGAVLGPTFLKLAKVKHPVARGIGMGTASHAIGTSRAMENSELEGAVSTVAMTVSAIIVAVITPLMIRLLL
ncbi:LrgB family protein [Aquibacillus salsiterrae]|uniref:LrgB family protein n=1 Tax=Aquibacillus salsiterrae TaxID=2950439 RepID=A0A9X3WGF8_9BACI|nr:LrgB family protein [Aquibacillus salsiterrae]MDC3418188.1 LrgB family protein [Aquibacillus salsiterrae]